MSKMYIMRGLPASGKSTKAKEICERDGNTVRINKDLIRTMLHFDKFNHRNEGVTQDCAYNIAKSLLESGRNVVIDDTNLNEKTVQRWKDLAKVCNAKIEYVDLTDVPVNECIFRDELREKKVGDHVIIKMALQYLNLYKDRKVIICDLDGTIADCTHRLHYLQGEKKDWKSFFSEISKDTFIEETYKKVIDELIKQSTVLIFVSARPEDYREETIKWLRENTDIICPVLIMREKGDKRPDNEVKQDIYDKYLKHLDIVKVFDDRPRVIEMWRSNGLEVEDCGNGIDF